MQTTVLQEVIAFIFGRKYYANIVGTKGVNKMELSSFIFRSKEEVEEHKEKLQATSSFFFIETISFRSRREYAIVKEHRSIKG